MGKKVPTIIYDKKPVHNAKDGVELMKQKIKEQKKKQELAKIHGEVEGPASHGHDNNSVKPKEENGKEGKQQSEIDEFKEKIQMLIANNEARLKNINSMMNKYNLKKGQVGKASFDNILQRPD